MSNLVTVPTGPQPVQGDLYVAFRVGDASYALPAAAVLQMESYEGATAVPGTAPYVVGVMPVRGRVVPVVDLRVRFGLPAAPLTLDSRVVVAQLHDRAVALLADSAREVVKVTSAELRPAPQLLEGGASGFVTHVVQSGARLLLILDLARVLGEESVDVR